MEPRIGVIFSKDRRGRIDNFHVHLYSEGGKYWKEHWYPNLWKSAEGNMPKDLVRTGLGGVAKHLENRTDIPQEDRKRLIEIVGDHPNRNEWHATTSSGQLRHGSVKSEWFYDAGSDGKIKRIDVEIWTPDYRSRKTGSVLYSPAHVERWEPKSRWNRFRKSEWRPLKTIDNMKLPGLDDARIKAGLELTLTGEKEGWKAISEDARIPEEHRRAIVKAIMSHRLMR